MNRFFIQFHYGHTPFSLVISYCKHTEWSYCINASVTHIIIMYLLHDCCTCAFVYCMYTKLLTSRTYRENSYVIFILYRPPIYIQQLCSCITAGCIHNCNYKLDSFIIDLTIKLIGSGVGAIYIHMRNRSWLFPVLNCCSVMVLKVSNSRGLKQRDINTRRDSLLNQLPTSACIQLVSLILQLWPCCDVWFTNMYSPGSEGVCACVCACVCVCVHACMCACVHDVSCVSTRGIGLWEVT